jgi:hypothetical protein
MSFGMPTIPASTRLAEADIETESMSAYQSEAQSRIVVDFDR